MAGEQLPEQRQNALRGAQFLHDRDAKFHIANDVDYVVGYLNQHAESRKDLVPNTPKEKIAAYIGFLADREYVNDGILTGDSESIERQLQSHIIDARAVPKSYFDLQKKIARERGEGEIVIGRQERAQHVEAIQTEQRSSLEIWVEYLGGDDGSYPDWFKHYTWTSVIKLGELDKTKVEFRRRSEATTKPFPELNQEALAQVYDTVHGNYIAGDKVVGGNFNKLYAQALIAASPEASENLGTIEGSWKKYRETSDARVARRLAGSLAGHGTGWCTAGVTTAAEQLSTGDFYVYYSKDQDGKDAIPRSAIRMHNGVVDEVRGILPKQALETAMLDITQEKLKDLPGGDVYRRRAEDMRLITEIDNRVSAGGELTAADLMVLRFTPITGFGYGADPRIESLLKNRDETDDFEIVKAEYGERNVIHMLKGTLYGQEMLAANLDKFDPRVLDHGNFADELLEDTDETSYESSLQILVKNLDKFEFGSVDQPDLAAKLLRQWRGHGMRLLAANLDKFEPGVVDHKTFARELLEPDGQSVMLDQRNVLVNNLEKFEPGVIDITALGADLLADFGQSLILLSRNLTKFDLDFESQRLLASKIMNSSGAMKQFLVGDLGSYAPGAVDQPELARRLMEEGDESLELVAHHLEKFESGAVNHDVLAQTLLAGDAFALDALSCNLDKFKDLSESTLQAIRAELD